MSIFDGTLFPPEGLITDGANLYKRTDPDAPWIFVDRVDPAQPFEIELLERQSVEIAAAFVVGGVEQDEDFWAIQCIATGAQKGDLADFSSAISDLAVAQDGPSVVIRWTTASNVVDYYELGFGATEETRIVLGKIPRDRSEERVGWWGSGATTYYLVAVSTAGVRSDTLMATVTIEAEDGMPIQNAVDEHADGFLGTKSDTEVSGGDLQIEDNPALTTSVTTPTTSADWPTWGAHKGSGTYTTAWVDVGSVVLEKVEVDATPALTKTTPTTKDVPVPPAPTILDGVDLTPGTRGVLQHVGTDLTLKTGLGLSVEIDTAQDGVPTSDGFRPWIAGKSYRYRQVRLRFTLAMPWLYGQLSLTALAWIRRRKNRKDEILATVVATGGTAVVFTEAFTGTPVVQATVEDNVARHATVDNVTASGCDVFLWDSGGIERGSGTVHVSVLGV